MRAIVLGKEVLVATDPPLNRRSGVDRVDATLGDYRDASAKGNLVHLLATESNGALSPAVVLLLHALAKFTHDAQGHDPTPYYDLGINRNLYRTHVLPPHSAFSNIKKNKKNG